MAFDCMAIGVGLFASVMATWPPNERFTYGYGRIETLSGFANGIFLILISIFIVFEAIQRLLEPPEMNTGQLLLVSILGLGVNLFGMFAMGGHHHHHASHSHGHSHPHSHPHHNDQSLSRPHSPIDGAVQSHEAHVHTHSCSHSPANLESSSIPNLRSSDHEDHGPVLVHSERRESKRDLHVPFIKTVASQRHLSVRGGSRDGLAVPLSSELVSPITPSYHFGYDDHFQTHHMSERAPNLHDHSHCHDGSHEGHSHNMRGVFLHVMADTLGSVGVIISTLLIQFYGWTGFDPIASLFIAIMIAASVVPLVVDTGKILALDVAGRDTIIQQALSELPHIQGLASYKSARFWPKDASSLIGSIHIQLASSLTPHHSGDSDRTRYSGLNRTVELVDAHLRSKISGLQELTIQVEGSED